MNKADVIVVGSGLMGLTSAYFLQKEGLSVVVIDKNSEVAKGASYANGGLLTPSMPEPWNSPGIHKSFFSYMFDKSAPLLFKPQYLHKYLSWGLKFLSSSSPYRHKEATINNLTLAMYSMDKLEEICDDLNPGYPTNDKGTLKIFRTEEGLNKAENSASLLRDYGLESDSLTQTKLLEIEPALYEVSGSLYGAIHYPNDKTGDARQFCLQLKSYLEQVGVEFNLDCHVERLDIKSDFLEGIFTSEGYMKSNKVVVTAGTWANRLLSKHRLALSIAPVKGYSVTLPINRNSFAPSIAVLDDDLHCAVTPLSDSLRLAGTAEFSAWDTRLNHKRVLNLLNFYKSLFPTLYANTDFEKQKAWCGLRPMSSDGNPFIGGFDSVRGLFVNTGHGPLGWTQCAGSGFLISSEVVGRSVNFPKANFRLNR